MRATFLHPVSLAVVLAGFAPAGGEKANGDDSAPAVRMYLQVEVRGTLRYDKQGVYVETKEQVEFRPPTTEPGGTQEKQVRWWLDLTAAEFTAEELKRLDGKVVEASGKAELRWVSEAPTGGADPLRRALPPRLEVQRSLAVAALKSVEKK